MRIKITNLNRLVIFCRVVWYNQDMIILFGPAGSGKSTQGRTIADKYGWMWLSAGQVLRDVGGFEEILKKGELVDDEEVVKLMNEQITRAYAEGMEVVLDGYPRDKKQAEIMLRDDETKFFDKIDVAIVLDVPKPELLKRVELRGRSDDTEGVLNRRIEIFEQNIYSILPLLEQKNVPIIKVDGVGEYDEVTERVERVVKKYMPNTTEVFNTEDLAVIENDTIEREKSYGE